MGPLQVAKSNANYLKNYHSTDYPALSVQIVRFPQLNLVALRVDEPAKTTKVILLDVGGNGYAFFPELREQRPQIGNPEIDHKGLLARVKIVGVFFENCKCRTPGLA